MSSAVNAQTPYHKASQEDRCVPRYPVRLAATLRPSGEKGYVVIVNDISCAGFSCSLISNMRPGHRCWLTLPGLASIEAEIAWNSGDSVGGAFVNLMHQAVLDAVLASHAH